MSLGTALSRTLNRAEYLVRARISKSFFSKKILDNVYISIKMGDKVAIVGPNGAGKTTLLRIISGLLNIDEGFVHRASITIYIPEVDFVPRLLSVKQWFLLHGCNLGLLARNLGSTVADLVRKFWDNRVTMLSKGQRRLIGLLAPLCRYRDYRDVVLLIDEPFSGLAKEYKSIIVNLIRRAQATMVIALHDLEDALAITDKIFYLEEGKLRELGSIQVPIRTMQLVIMDNQNKVIYKRDIKNVGELLELLYEFAKAMQGVKKICIESSQG